MSKPWDKERVLKHLEVLAEEIRKDTVEVRSYQIDMEPQKEENGFRTKPSGAYTVTVTLFDHEMAARDYYTRDPYDHEVAVAAAHKAMPEIP